MPLRMGEITWGSRVRMTPHSVVTTGMLLRLGRGIVSLVTGLLETRTMGLLGSMARASVLLLVARGLLLLGSRVGLT